VALDREKTLQAAQKYVDRKKYDKAVEEYQKIVREDPKDARTLLKIGDLQARMQAYTDAIATYDRVGQQYAAQGFALKAIAVYKQVRELIRKHAPELADRYAHIVPKLAEIYTHLGLPSDALAAYDEVATHYQRTGRDREAIDVFRKMVELDPNNPLPHLRLAEACCRVNELDPAVGAFWTAAELLLGMERRDDALKVIERILHFRQDPQYARAAAELYLQKATREDGLQALAKLQICFQANPKDLETLALLAQAFTTINAEAKAVEVYKEMARVAREQGRQDLFEQLLAHLQSVAPDDDQVRALRSLPPASGSVAPSSAPRSSPNLEDTDLELIEEEPSLRPPAEAPPRPFAVSSPDVVVEVERTATGETAALDLHEHTRKAVVDAESFRKLRLYSKAIEALRLALDLDPGSVEIRDKLRGVLEESGDLEGAAQEAVRLAEVYLAHQDHETAQALCYEALQLAPESVAARQLLTQLGAPLEVPAWEAYADSARDEPTVGRYATGPLPSYDLEEMGPTAVMGQSASPPPSAALEHVDDPFAELDNAPLPSFPLGPEEDTAARADGLPSYGVIDDSLGVGEYVPMDELVGGGASYATDAAYPADEPALYRDAAAEALGAMAEPYEVPTDAAAYAAEDYPRSDEFGAGAAAPPADAQVEAVEEALEEAEFYASRGLYDDACAVIKQQLARTPNHPLLIERLRELGQLAPGESGTIDRSQLGAIRRPPKPRDQTHDASLEDALAPAADVLAHRQKGSIRDEVDVDEVFARFKEGIRQQVPEGDAATHYDLGVAYQGMGLLGDAVREFEVAARDPERECNCYAMIGLIGLEQGELDQAETAYLRGLEAEKKSVEQAMSLYYDLGNVKEMKGQRDDALYYFKMIARRDPGFRDVKDRIAALEPPPVASTTRTANEDDEFDAAFDKLFESS
jgi:tetratricopeptide (TPR) repeat protein